MARFVIDTGSIEMDRESREDLANELQKVVLSRIAEMRVDGPIAIKFPILFPGLVIGPEFDQVLKLEKKLAERFN